MAIFMRVKSIEHSPPDITIFPINCLYFPGKGPCFPSDIRGFDPFTYSLCTKSTLWVTKNYVNYRGIFSGQKCTFQSGYSVSDYIYMYYSAITNSTCMVAQRSGWRSGQFSTKERLEKNPRICGLDSLNLGHKMHTYAQTNSTHKCTFITKRRASNSKYLGLKQKRLIKFS